MSDFGWPPAKNEIHEKFHDDLGKLSLESRVVSAKAVIPRRIDPLVTPIYHSTTYRYDTVAQFNETSHGQNAVYQRCGNPTVDTAEVAINELEGGAATLLYNSGLAACSAIFLEFLNAGDHIICMYPMYSGSFSFLSETMVRFGVEMTFVDLQKHEEDFVAEVKRSIKPNTKLMHFEVVANPTMHCIPMKELIQLANEAKVKVCFDATFASPVLCHPIKLGADFSLHSCSKYIGGHTDVIAGCVTTKDMKDWQRLKLQQLTTGSSLSPFDAALITRGLKTVILRVEKISTNALKVAQFLESHPKVVSVTYAGLPSNKAHKKACEFFKGGFGGMIAFDVGTAKAAIALVENLRLVVRAVSLGGVESLIEHPASWSHGSQFLRGEDHPTAIGEGILRLSIGVESADDLVADFERALSFA